MAAPFNRFCYAKHSAAERKVRSLPGNPAAMSRFIGS